jgi:hypothetical protein
VVAESLGTFILTTDPDDMTKLGALVPGGSRLRFPTTVASIETAAGPARRTTT